MALSVSVELAVVEPGVAAPLVHVQRSALTWNPEPENRQSEAELANAALDTLASAAVEDAQGRLTDIMNAVDRREREAAERIRRLAAEDDEDER